jgi:hypothetical protein
LARTLLLGALLILTGARCTAKRSATNDAATLHVTAARTLTQRYAASRFQAWHIRAAAAGSDCGVLLLQTEIILEDSMIEAMHYGAGSYDTYNGGVQRFLRVNAFRGVAYKDVSGRIWTYGSVSPDEAERLVACR